MFEFLKLWVVFAVLAVLFKTWFYILQKKYLDEDVSPYTTSYITSFYGALITVPLAVWDIVYNNVEVSPSLIPILILFGFAESLYFLVYLFALNNLNISIASPIKKSKSVFIGITEPIVLGAQIPVILLGCSFLASIGGVMSVIGSDDSFDSYKNDLTKIGILFAFLTLFMGVAVSLISRFGTSEISPFVFGAGVTTTMLLVTRILLYNSDVEKKSIKITSKKGILLGSIGGLRSVTVWIAYSLVVATAVSTLTQTTLILDAVVAKYYLDEKVTKIQFIGIVLIFIGSLITVFVI